LTGGPLAKSAFQAGGHSRWTGPLPKNHGPHDRQMSGGIRSSPVVAERIIRRSAISDTGRQR